MNEQRASDADCIALFCRLHLNGKKNLPVRSSEMGLLIYASKREAPVTPLEISEFFKISKPAVTVMIRALLEQDYLHKVSSHKDGRSYTVTLTSKGTELVETTASAHFSRLERLEREMGTPDFRQLLNLLQRANAILLNEAGERP